MFKRVASAALVVGLVIGVAGTWVVQGAAAGARPAGHAPAQAVAGTDVTAAGAARTTVRVRGTQVPINADKGVYATRGDLLGRWTFVPVKVLHKTPTLYVESGRERFAGCLDRNRDRTCQAGEPHGLLRANYLYWASFDGSGKLVRGQCVHPVVGGTGSFASARGVLHMVDTPAGGNAVRTTYRGRLVLTTALAPAAASAPWTSGAALGSGAAASTRVTC